VELSKQFEIGADSDSSSSSSQSETLSIAPSQSLSSEADAREVSGSIFRLLEKHVKPMEVDIEDGHVKSVRIEV